MSRKVPFRVLSLYPPPLHTEALVEALDLQTDDRLDLGLAEGLEHHELIHPARALRKGLGGGGYYGVLQERGFGIEIRS